MSFVKFCGFILILSICSGACRDQNIEGPNQKLAEIPIPREVPNSLRSTEAVPKTSSCTKQLTQLAKILRTGTARDGISVFGLPVVVVEQDYELKDAGEPYVATPPRVRTLKSRSAIEDFIRWLKKRVENVFPAVSNAQTQIEPAISSTLTANFNATGMEICQLTLEVGDLEHVVVIALDPSSNLIRAVYLN